MPQAGEHTRLTGTIKLIAGFGAGVGGRGGGIVSNNGGAIISDYGGGLVSKTRYGLVAAEVAEYVLADAPIRLHDATGALLVDEQGEPLTATSGPDGAYALSAVLPKGALVLRVALGTGGVLAGGELAALVSRPAAGEVRQGIDTATSLGAAYVLGEYVKGDQAVLDKLPAREAAQLEAGLAAAQALITAPPRYLDADLIALSERLRAQAPAVDAAFEAIRALLLGQARGGDGRAATGVAVFAPAGLARDGQGRLLFGEPNFGRLRLIQDDGRIATEADLVRGRLKQNFPRLRDFVRARDGSLLIAIPRRVVRLTPDGRVEPVAGDDTTRYAALDVPATATGVQPGCLALGADGTVYVGERRSTGDEPGIPRVIAVGPDGVARRVPVDDGWGVGGRVNALEVGPDGTLYVLYVDPYVPGAPVERVYAYHPARGPRVVADGFPLTVGQGDLALGPDGTLWVSEPDVGRIEAIAPDGARRVVAERGQAGGPNFPSHLLVDADGTVVVADPRAGRIFARDPGGAWRVLAGTDAAVQVGADLTNLALNAPSAAIFDRTGGLIVAEEGGRTIKRFDGRAFTTLAGAFEGDGADGRPAREAPIGPPRGLALRGDELVFSEGETGLLRAIAPDGTLRTLAGAPPRPDVPTELAAGERVGPTAIASKADQLAVDAAGRLYWANGVRQILRLAADGRIEAVAGRRGPPGAGYEPDLQTLLNPEIGDGGPAIDATLSAPKGLAFDAAGDLFLADTRNMRVRRIRGPERPVPTIASFAGASLATLLGRADQLGRAEEGVLAADATLIAPSGLCVDARGTMFVSELGSVALPLYGSISGAPIKIGMEEGIPPVHARVRKIAPDGTVTTIAGPGGRWFPDPAAEDALVLPTALALAPDGRLAIVDSGANRVIILPAGRY